MERFDLAAGGGIGGPVTLEHAGRDVRSVCSAERRPACARRPRIVTSGQDECRARRRDADVRRRFAVAGGTLPGSVIALEPATTARRGRRRRTARCGFLDLQSGRLRTASGRHRGARDGARASRRTAASLVTPSDDGDGDPVGRPRGARRPRRLQGHANGITALQIAGDGRTLYTAGASTARSSSGISPARGASAADRRRRAHRDSFARAELRRPAPGARPADGAISVVDRGGRTGAPDVRRGRRDGVDGRAPWTGIRFVPGSRLAVVLGANEFVVLVDTDRGRDRAARSRRGPATEPDAGNRLANPIDPGVSADGSLLATAQAAQRGRHPGRSVDAPERPPRRAAAGCRSATIAERS